MSQPRASKRVIRKLETISEHLHGLMGDDGGHCALPDDVKAAVRLYVSTWCAQPLDDVIAHLRGDDSKL